MNQRAPGEAFMLMENAAHIWYAWLDQAAMQLPHFVSLLSGEEEIHAAQLRDPRERQRFITRRGILRILVGGYLRRDPHALQLTYPANGKPMLAASDTAAALQFNLSHSHRLAVYVFARHACVGIDVEYRQTNINYAPIVRHFFTATTRQELNALPVAHRQDAFLRHWTRQEAMLKARGWGLTHGLQPETGDESAWSWYELASDTAYIATLAARQERLHLTYRQWESSGPIISPIH